MRSLTPGTPFSKAGEIFGPAKPFLVHHYLKSPETSCMKEASAHVKKRLCSHKLGDFGTVYRPRKLFVTCKNGATGIFRTTVDEVSIAMTYYYSMPRWRMVK